MIGKRSSGGVKRLIAVIAFFFPTMPAVAEETEPEASPASVSIGNYAKRKTTVAPRYPRSMQRRGIEGWVLLSYVVTPKGKVIDPIVEDSSGEREFERAALKVITKWTYEPATWNGRPVEQCHTNIRMTFMFDEPGIGAGRIFRKRYRKIVDLIGEDRLDEAELLLKETFELKKLNLYEVSRAWILSAMIAQSLGLKDGELVALRKASVSNGNWIEPDVYEIVLRNIFWLEIETERYSAALGTYRKLEQLEDALTPEISEAHSQIMAQVQGDKIIGTSGEIIYAGENDGPAYWIYRPLRNDFGFDELEGDIRSFEIRCDWKRASIDIESEKSWTIPEAWGDCSIVVFGDMGSKFKILEYPATPEA